MAKHKRKKQPPKQQHLSPEQFLKQRMHSLEINACYMSDSITECGLGHIIVSRRHTGGRISMCMYLVDTYCLGVKDSLFQFRLEEYEFETFINRIPELRECTYEEAHNWIYGAVSWAEEADIEPDKSFELTEYMLKEDNDDVPLIEYEFGYKGKHHLMASDAEIDHYYPILEKNLGKGNFNYTVRTDSSKDIDYSPKGMSEWLTNPNEIPLFKIYGPSTEYTYQHPEYPQTLQLTGPDWLYQELKNPKDELCLSDGQIDRILTLPYDEVRQDLESIILYNIGQTCDNIPQGDDAPDEFYCILPNCTLLLGEVGNQESSLAVVLEMMRQSNDFMDYHFGDAGSDFFTGTLYLLGQNRLDVLMNFIKEEGLDTYCKSYVFPAVANIAILQPERRGEVIEWFREVLRFATEMLPKTQWFDSTLSGLILNDLIDIQAKELLPEIRDMFATELVDLGSCGNYNKVAHMVKNPRYADTYIPIETEIHKRFAKIKRMWSKA